MMSSMDPIQSLFFVITLVALVMLATVVFMVSNQNYQNTDRLKDLFKDK